MSISSPQHRHWQRGFFLYSRKSTEAEDRQVLSIESQLNEVKKIAETLGLPILEVFSESKSAKAPGRPVFNDMMRRIYTGEADGILCWKLDRLARNPVDGGSIIWTIKQHGIKIITPTQSYSHDDDNTILMYIEFGMAQKYIDDLSRNVKRGLRTKVEKGWYPGIAPLGYLNNKQKDKGEKDLLKDPERFPLVKRTWDLMLTGLYTPPKILKILNNDWHFRTRQMRKLGDKPLARSRIYEIFTDPFYYGWFEYPKNSGQWYKGSHEPMITEEEFDRVQILLGRKGNPRAVAHTFPFTGLIRCGECGAMVTAEEKHQLICPVCRYKFAYRQKDRCPRCQTLIDDMNSPMLLHYTYYHCTKSKYPRCSQGSISAQQLEEQIDNYLSHIEISERLKDWALEYLHETHEHEVAGRNSILQSQQKRYQDCLKRLDNLVKLKTSPQNADGILLSDEEYGRQRTELLKEKAQLEELFRDTGQRVEHWLELTEKTLEFACSARKWFAEGNMKIKKVILTAIGSNLILKDKKLTIEAKKPFLILEKSLPRMAEAKSTFEPKNFRMNKGKRELVHSLNPSGLRR
ncbi:MAG: recombinase family protein [bacterium]|nr:recombinase family protein [bacterium]